MSRPEVSASLPEKFRRLLHRFDFARTLKDKRVCIKMHLGGASGYKTIHPLFVRILVEEIKSAGGNPFITDCPCDSPQRGVARGYTQEVVGAPIIAATGVDDKYFYSHKLPKTRLKEVELAGNIQDSDVLINFV